MSTLSRPEYIDPKIVRWGWRVGSENLKFGKFFGGKRGGPSSSNSGPTGKRAARFYPGRAVSGRLGKHGLSKLNRRT